MSAMFRDVISWLLLVFWMMGVFPGTNPRLFGGPVIAREGESADIDAGLVGFNMNGLKVNFISKPSGERLCTFVKTFTMHNVAFVNNTYCRGVGLNGRLSITFDKQSEIISITVTPFRVTQSYNGEVELEIYDDDSHYFSFWWLFYVLGSGKIPHIANTYLVRSGETVNGHDFPRPPQTMIEYASQNYNMTEKWIFDGGLQSMTFEINKESSGKNLSYTISNISGLRRVSAARSATINFTLSVISSSLARSINGIYIVREGSSVRDFPHLISEKLERLNVTEQWYLNEKKITSPNITADPERKSSILTYVLTDKASKSVRYDYKIAIVSSSLVRNTNGVYFVRENSSVRVTDFPHLSPEILESLNVTEQWYLNEKKITCLSITADREVNSSVLTYVLTDKVLKSVRFNYKIATSYGPSPNATFIPKHSIQIIKEGATVPTIRCEVECFPPCNIVWSKDDEMVSDTRTLSLGQATDATTGEYICTASNNATNLWTTKSLFVYTEDHTRGSASRVIWNTQPSRTDTRHQITHCEQDKGSIQQNILYGLVAVLTLICVVPVILLLRMKRQLDSRGNNRVSYKSGKANLGSDGINQPAPEGTFTSLTKLERVFFSPNGQEPAYINLIIDPAPTDTPGPSMSPEAASSSQAEGPTGEVSVYMDLIRSEDTHAENQYIALDTGNESVYMDLIRSEDTQAENQYIALDTDTPGPSSLEAASSSQVEVPTDEVSIYMDLIRPADTKVESPYTALATDTSGPLSFEAASSSQAEVPTDEVSIYMDLIRPADTQAEGQYTVLDTGTLEATRTATLNTTSVKLYDYETPLITKKDSM